MSSEDQESNRNEGSRVRLRRKTMDTVVAASRGRVIAAPVRAAQRLLRVLVVDDNKDATDSLSLLVEIWGHEARRAYDGESALEMARTFLPDVVLLDIAMPKVNGCQVARQLRLQTVTRNARLIAITGYADQAHRLLCRVAGFDDYLIKPVPTAVVEELLSRQRKLMKLEIDMHTSLTSSIIKTMAWQVWAIPVDGPRGLVKTYQDKRKAIKAARAFNHATPWVFHDVQRTIADVEDDDAIRTYLPERGGCNATPCM